MFFKNLVDVVVEPTAPTLKALWRAAVRTCDLQLEYDRIENVSCGFGEGGLCAMVIDGSHNSHFRSLVAEYGFALNYDDNGTCHIVIWKGDEKERTGWYRAKAKPGLIENSGRHRAPG